MTSSLMTIGIVSISSIIPHDQLDLGTNTLAQAGYAVKVASNVAGPDVAPAADRAKILEEFWLDPEIDLLLFSRGGQGAVDVIPLIDWDALSARPDLPVVGFSDLTILLNAMLAKGVGHPLSGPMLSYAGTLTPAAQSWFDAALSGTPLPPVKTTPIHVPGSGAPSPATPASVAPPVPSGGSSGSAAAGGGVSGLPMGGHIERLHRLLGMGLLPPADGRVVFLECTARYAPGDIRRWLEELRDAGAFSGAAAVVFCDFRHKGAARAEIDAFIPPFAATLPCPVFSGFPYGHTHDSRLLDFRRPVSIAADGTLTFR
ncbi:MAG: LD-carboxypeptidase [Kiritimatiellae bacterium]|nr:LD-carboxypeptidase [Kiritimatiellia bacterium]